LKGNPHKMPTEIRSSNNSFYSGLRKVFGKADIGEDCMGDANLICSRKDMTVADKGSFD